ncbi:MAG: ABC transporter permease [Lachnospiraceae bacterium]|nr:ABC transporter permease [Lachnospiraceae bacterium]
MKKNKLSGKFRVFFGRGILSKICFFIIIALLVVAVFAPLLAPYDPNKNNLRNIVASPSGENLLGTDYLGRDVISRLIYGARISLYTSLLAGVLSALIGILLGLLAGYFGGLLSSIIMRITDALLAIPALIFTLVLASVLGGGLVSIVISIGISLMPTYIRMVNGQVLSLKESDYITAGKLIGLKDFTILIRHLFPNCFPSLIVLFTMNLGEGIMMESTMSYLGVGIAPPTATWGSMVSDGYSYLTTAPLLSILPGICIILVVVAFNIVGDGLRDALDPRLRGKL